MRRLLTLALLTLACALPLRAQQDYTTTANLALKKPNVGSTNWSQYINSDFDTLDAAIGVFKGGFVNVPFSATPVFDLTKGNTFQITLSGNVTSSSVNQPFVQPGQLLYLIVCQNAVGGFTFAFPASFQTPVPTLTTTLSKCSDVTWQWNGSIWISAGGGSGGGGGASPSPPNGALQMTAGNNLASSALNDNGTTVSSSESVVINGLVNTLTVGGTIVAGGGSGTATLPPNTGMIAELNLPETWTAAQTHNASTLLLNPGPITFASLGSAARTATFPDNTGTVAELNAAQTFTANQTIDNAHALRFLSINGTNYAGFQGGASTLNLVWLFPSTDSTGTQCLSSNGSLQLAWSNCSAGTGTPGGSNTQVQYNAAGSFGGSTNLTWVSPALSLGSTGTATGQLKFLGTTSGTVTTQAQDAAGTWTFKWPNGTGSANQAMITDGTGVASWATLPVGGGGTGATTIATNTLVVGNGTSPFTSLTGTLAGTNPVLTITSAAIGNVPFAVNTPASPTADLFDLNINSVKTAWFDSTGTLHAPGVTTTGTGPTIVSGTGGTCPSPVIGQYILCLGDSTSTFAQLSNNGTSFKPIAQLTNNAPTAHGVVLATPTAPQLSTTAAGATGLPLVGQGGSADPIFAALGVAGGGTGALTLTAHGPLLGEGTSAIVAAAAGTAGQPFLSGGAGADGAYGALNVGTAAVTGVLATANGGTGASTLSGASIVTVTGVITAGDCVKFSSATVATDAGGPCTTGSSPARLDQILAGTASNTINSTVFPQTWNWALTGSIVAMKFGENTSATGSSNIILQATTLASSTAKPFQADNAGNGVSVSSTGVLAKLGTGSVNADALNGTAFAGTNGDLVSFGAANIPADTGFLATNVVRKDAANTGAAAMTLDMSAATGATAFKVPVIAGATAGADGVIDYDSTNKNTHIRANGADAINLAIPSAPTTGDVADYLVASGNVLAHDSGVLTANLVTAAANYTSGDLVQAAASNKTTSDSGIATANVATAASNAGSSKQLALSGGANKTLSFITFPDTKYAPAANCVNAVAGSGWSTGATPAALCRAGTNNKTALLSPWGASDVGYIQFHIPADADLTTQLPSLMLEVTTTESSTHTIIMQESVACAKEDGSTTDDVAFNAARSFATVTETTRANQVFDTTITLNSTDLTGCVAPGVMWVKVSRTTDTATNVGVYGLNLTTYRLLTVQAN